MADTFYQPIDIAETADNTLPPVGFQRLQARPDGQVYIKNSQGVETPLGNTASSGGFVPTLLGADETFELPENTQALFFKRIKLEDGARLKIFGILGEVH